MNEDKTNISGELDIKLKRKGKIIRHQRIARGPDGKMEELVTTTPEYE